MLRKERIACHRPPFVAVGAGSSRGSHGSTSMELSFDRTMAARRCKRFGFTLIELLVVIAIIALLVSILVPSLKSVKELARRVICLSNMRSIGTGYHMYDADYDAVPPYSMSGSYAPNLWALWSWILVEAKYLPGQALPHFDGAKGGFFKCPSKGMIRDKYRSWDHWASDYSPNVWVSSGYNDAKSKKWFSLSAATIPAELYFLGENQKRLMNVPELGGLGWAPGQSYLDSGRLDIDDWVSSYGYKAHGDRTHMLFADGHVESLPGLEPNETYTYKKMPWWDASFSPW